MRKLSYVSLSLVLALLVGANYCHGAPNLLANGGYEDGVLDPWGIYGDAVGEVVQENPIEGKYCLHVTTPQGGNFWDAGLQHSGHVFDQGKNYTLAAFLRSPDNLQINFKPELGADPWTGYGSQEFTMTDTWDEYHVETGAIPENVDPATITFHIAYAVGEFYIDAVRFYEGAYTPGEPSAVRSEDKIATVWGKIKAN